MNVASLGISVDSGSADTGARALDNLVGASKRAEAAAAAMSRASYSAAQATKAEAAAALAAARASNTSTVAEKAAARSAYQNASAAAAAAKALYAKDRASMAAANADDIASAAANANTQALHAQSAAAAKTAAAVRSAGVAVNDNARRMGGSMSGLAAQFQDIGVTAAMDMNPMIIGLQQGTQIAGQMEMALQGGVSASTVFGTALRSLLSPVSLVAIGLTVAAAAAIQMVDWAAAGAGALNMLADALEVIAPYAAMAAAGLALLYAPAIIGGIVQVIALLARMTTAAVGAAVAMAAANPAAAFVLGITAAVAAANIFRDELTQIFGFDIVGAAKDGVNMIIGTFVGGYNGIVAAWNLLPAALGDVAARAGWMFAEQIRYWINESLLLVGDFIDSLNDKLGTSIAIPNLLGPIKAPKSSGAAAGLSNAIAEAMKSAQGVDYVGEIGGAISKGASAAAEKLRELAAGFGEVDEAAKKAGKGAGKDDPWKGLRKATDDTLKKMQELAEKSREAAKTLGQGLGGIFEGLINKTMTWKDAALSALKAVLQYMNTMNINQGGKGLFGGGFLQGLIGGFLGMSFANGGAFQGGNVIPFANGGVVNKPTLFPMANGAGLMGEAGPEAIMPLKRGPSGRLGVEMSGAGGSSVSIGDTNVIIQGNVDRDTLPDIREILKERDKRLKNEVFGAINQNRTRGTRLA